MTLDLQSCTHRCKEQLFNAVKTWGHCDLLIDREIDDPLHDEIENLIEAGHEIHIINPLKAALPEGDALVLVRLTLRQLSLLDSSVEIAVEQNTNLQRRARSIGGWLFGSIWESRRIASHLERMQIARLPDGSKALLRLWDPRVFPQLIQIFTPSQVAEVFGEIQQWAWVDRMGCLISTDRQVSRVPGPVLDPSLRLTSEQDQAIDQIEALNLLLMALHGLGHMVSPQNDFKLRQLLHTAHTKGYTVMPDLIAYGLHAYLFGTDFDELPSVKTEIKNARDGKLSLCSALERFDDAFWAAQHRLKK